jgi:hypothetical protein
MTVTLKTGKDFLLLGLKDGYEVWAEELNNDKISG